MAIFGLIAGLFNRWLFLVALFTIIPIIYLVNRFFMIIKWNLAEGIIEDVKERVKEKGTLQVKKSKI